MDSSSLNRYSMQSNLFFCLIVTSALLVGIPASYAGHDVPSLSKQKSTPTYPRPLVGVWMSGIENCSINQTYDSERLIEVTPRLLIGYEQASKPTKVSLVSREPLAWRIESVLDVGPSGVFKTDDPRLFVLGTNRLTVATGHDVSVYTRCE